MSIVALATYQPAWQSGRRRALGTDEDLLTLAVSAITGLGGRVPQAKRIIVVLSTPDVLNPSASGILRRAVGLTEPVPVEVRLGGSTATVEALASAAAGTIVVGVEDGSAGAAAGAALIEAAGMPLGAADRVDRSLPMRVRDVEKRATHVYDDARLERERGWAPAVRALSDGASAVFLAGIPAKEAGRLGGTVLPDTDPTEAAAPIFVLAAMAAGGHAGRLVAVDSALGCSVDITALEAVDVSRSTRSVIPAAEGPRFDSTIADIPLSLPAYDRAFESRLGLAAAECECGQLSYPPRLVCLQCGEMESTHPVTLPRSGSVYTVVTVHIKVPGLATPMARAVVELDGVPVRVLMPVTDCRPLDCAIGDHGSLVFRRIATREGVPDYGYAFQPDERQGEDS